MRSKSRLQSSKRTCSRRRRAMSNGTVESIYIASAAKGPMQAVDQVAAIPGAGLEGDRYALKLGTFYKPEPDYELTLIEAEAIEALRRGLSSRTRCRRCSPQHRDAQRPAESSGGSGVCHRRRAHSRHPLVRALRSFAERDGQAGDQGPAASRRIAGADSDARHDSGRGRSQLYPERRGKPPSLQREHFCRKDGTYGRHYTARTRVRQRRPRRSGRLRRRYFGGTGGADRGGLSDPPRTPSGRSWST